MHQRMDEGCLCEIQRLEHEVTHSYQLLAAPLRSFTIFHRGLVSDFRPKRPCMQRMNEKGNADIPSRFPDVLIVLVPLDFVSNLGAQLGV